MTDQSLSAQALEYAQRQSGAKPRPKTKDTAADQAVKDKAYQGAAGTLTAFAHRHDNLAEQKAAVDTDIKALMAEIKAAGFSTKAFKAAMKYRAADAPTRDAMRGTLAETDLYLAALDIDTMGGGAE